MRRPPPSPDRRTLLSLFLLTALCLPLVVAAQEIRLGSEFQVNTWTTDYQSIPSIAMRAGGDFVVTWQDKVQDGSGFGIFARLFSSAGSPLAAELQVTTHTLGYQRQPVVAAATDGGCVDQRLRGARRAFPAGPGGGSASRPGVAPPVAGDGGVGLSALELAVLERARAQAQAVGQPLTLLVALPSARDAARRELESLAAERGLGYLAIDVPADDDRFVFGSYDGHWNERANARIAEQLASAIEARMAP